jgi:hypothetical protein
VGKVATGRVERDACLGRGEHHLGARFDVAGVVDRPDQEFADCFECLGGEGVGKWIGTLRHRPVDPSRWIQTARPRPRRDRLERVAHAVESARGHDLRGQREGDRRVDQGHGRDEPPGNNAGLGVDFGQIEDRDARGLGAGPRGRGTGDVRPERTRDLLSAADRRVDVGHELGRMRRIQVRGLARVHHRTAADRHVPVEPPLRREARRGLKRRRRGLDRDLVIHDGLEARGTQRSHRRRDMDGAAEVLVGEERHALHAQLQRLIAGLGQAPGAERKRRHADRERAVAGIGKSEIGVAASHGGTSKGMLRAALSLCQLRSLEPSRAQLRFWLRQECGGRLSRRS